MVQPVSAGDSSQDSSNKPSVSQHPKKKPEDFIFGRILGEGSYSTVFFAVEKATEHEYAIKIMNKNHIRREKKEHIAMREKKILACLHHPFFVRLRYTFQDDFSLYYVLTLAKGGELLEYIKHLKRFNYMLTRFYSAEIFYAVDYLHSKNILHRDLKPENILISDSLHIKITDFGTSKSLNESSNPNHTNSFVGTAQYVAPELIKSSTASRSSDIWAVGCMVYQMSTGSMAFHDSNTYHIFQKITKIEYTIPEDIHADITDLIKKILVQEPEARLGSLEQGGFIGITAHPLFNDIIWEKLHLTIPPEQMSIAYNHLQAKITKEFRSESVTKDDQEEDENSDNDDSVTEKVVDSTINLFEVRLKKNFIGNKVKSLTISKVEKKDNSGSDSTTDDSNWEKFCFGYKILKKGILYKLRGIKPRKRMFLITEGPHIFYVDPKSMQLKGKVQWGKQLCAHVIDEVSWCINIPGRTFHLEDRDGSSATWVDFIMRLHESYFPDKNST